MSPSLQVVSLARSSMAERRVTSSLGNPAQEPTRRLRAALKGVGTPPQEGCELPNHPHPQPSPTPSPPTGGPSLRLEGLADSS